MLNRKRVITAEEAIKILQETGRIEEDIIIKDYFWMYDTYEGDVWMCGDYEDDVRMNGNYKGDVRMNGNYEGDVLMNGNYKGDIWMYGNYKGNVLMNGAFGGKIYTDQKLIAEIAHLAGIPVIISLKDFQREK